MGRPEPLAGLFKDGLPFPAPRLARPERAQRAHPGNGRDGTGAPLARGGRLHLGSPRGGGVGTETARPDLPGLGTSGMGWLPPGGSFLHSFTEKRGPGPLRGFILTRTPT